MISVQILKLVEYLGSLSFMRGFTCVSAVKESSCNAGDGDSIPASGRSTGEGNSNSLQYSSLGNPMERGAWRAAVHGVTGVEYDLDLVGPPPPTLWIFKTPVGCYHTALPLIAFLFNMALLFDRQNTRSWSAWSGYCASLPWAKAQPEVWRSYPLPKI